MAGYEDERQRQGMGTMPQMIPWRIRKFVSDRFPLFYHFACNMGFSGNSAAYWDRRLAETWDDPRLEWPDKNELLENLTAKDDVILDIASGNGTMLRHLKDRGYHQLHGLDISSYAVSRLSEEGICMRLGKLPRLPFPDDMFDVVIASQILEHVIRRRRFVREIARVMAADGRAFIFVPDNCLGPIDENEHVIKYDQQSLQKFLSSYFSHVHVESMHDRHHQSPILYAKVLL